jgi:hypothetical protein
MYTGTKKRVHLRAESGEDRAAWVEALRAVKEMFPRVSNAELMAESMVVSTERLRQRLLEEGLSEAAIQDCENIMRAELSQMHKHLVVLKQKQLLLIDALRHLEVLLSPITSLYLILVFLPFDILINIIFFFVFGC